MLANFYQRSLKICDPLPDICPQPRYLFLVSFHTKSHLWQRGSPLTCVLEAAVKHREKTWLPSMGLSHGTFPCKGSFKEAFFNNARREAVWQGLFLEYLTQSSCSRRLNSAGAGIQTIYRTSAGSRIPPDSSANHTWDLLLPRCEEKLGYSSVELPGCRKNIIPSPHPRKTAGPNSEDGAKPLVCLCVHADDSAEPRGDVWERNHPLQRAEGAGLEPEEWFIPLE